MENEKKYENEKNETDFNVYYPKTISMNAYSDRLLAKVKQAKGHAFDSQTIRNLIYEEYHRLKDQDRL